MANLARVSCWDEARVKWRDISIKEAGSSIAPAGRQETCRSSSGGKREKETCPLVAAAAGPPPPA